MTEILPGVHQIDPPTGDASFTTHVYLLKDPRDEYTLIDSGLPGSDGPIRAYLREHSIDPKAIRRLLITHLHRDHVGGLKAVIAMTGATTYAHWIEAAFLRGSPKYDGPGVPPAEPIEVDRILKDGETVEAFGGLVAYHTPGHTPGHTSYFQAERRILFSGDLFFGDGGAMSLTPPEYTLHRGTAMVSAQRMDGLSPESILSYHGGPFVKGGAARLGALVQSFR